MKLLILGASGHTGTLVVQQALAAGHAVTAFVRDPARLKISDSRLRVVTGDARNTADLEQALVGQDAVISTLGTRKLSDDLITASSHALSEAMKKTGIRRLVVMTTFLHSEHFRQNAITRLLRQLMKGVLGDKITGEQEITQADLDWTIAHATALRGGPATGQYRIGTFEVTVGDSIARADVATALIEIVAEPQYIRQSVVLTTKKETTS